MERALRIESFRNIGFKDGKPSCERLVINNSLNKGPVMGIFHYQKHQTYLFLIHLGHK